MSMLRRDFLRMAAAFSTFALTGEAMSARAAGTSKPRVYFTRDLSARGLVSAYERVSADITGRVACKIHTGEPHGPYILPRDWVKALLDKHPGTLVETNVYYEGPRHTTEEHRKVLETNGWAAFARVDILDEDGDAVLPVKKGRWLKEFHVGAHLLNYDSLVVLTHFKGHSTGGYGGSLKNIAIGCADARVGKVQLHFGADGKWDPGARFMERMVEGCGAVLDHFGKRVAFVNVLRCMSVDCDCAGVKALPPEAPDLGILASTDLLAIEQASVDMVYALPEKERAALVERIESRSGLRQLSYMKELGMGDGSYELVEI